MSSDAEIAVALRDVSKCYHLYATPADRLKQFIVPRLRRHVGLPLGRDRYFQEFWSLRETSLEIKRGEVLGILGVNGAGKSTLLQLVTGVLQATTGEVRVRGRIAALLELGAGFNPEFTGRENVFLNASLLGLSTQETRERYDEIVEFSGIGAFIDQPVKTYSSGMYVRLAFAIATSVDPDVLIIDEALSVGDGAFARKSFERIMALKAKGATILFCSHNVYQVEALSHRALWLDQGRVRALGLASKVCQQYNQFLEDGVAPAEGATHFNATQAAHARIRRVRVTAGGEDQQPLQLISEQSELQVQVDFSSSMDVPCPSVAVIITDNSGRNITSCCNHYDGYRFERDTSGNASITATFPRFGLLKGHYVVHVFLLCEQAIHIYDSARCAELDVSQPGFEIGVTAIAREWSHA